MSRVFIVAGGPSVASQDTDRLRGERVIAINSSWERVLFAEVLFFGDERWWRVYGTQVLDRFTGRIVCADQVWHPRVECLRRRTLPGLSSDPREVTVHRTSLTGALNLAVHMGFRDVVLLGADGKPGPDGRLHHHEEYGPKLVTIVNDQLWRAQHDQLNAAARDLAQLGISVVNASPGSALADIWPVTTLDDVLNGDRAAA